MIEEVHFQRLQKIVPSMLKLSMKSHDIDNVRELTKRIHEVVENRWIIIKIYSNSPILEINHELEGIEVNKGLIHRELRYF